MSFFVVSHCNLSVAYKKHRYLYHIHLYIVITFEIIRNNLSIIQNSPKLSSKSAISIVISIPTIAKTGYSH